MIKNKFRVLLFCFLGCIFQGTGQISFEDQAALLEIDVAYGFGFFGGGISLFDYNNDGWDDLSLSTAAGSDFYFFKNNNGTFELDPVNIEGGFIQTKQVVWVDYNNDGNYDFFAASDDGNSKLYRNNTNNSFSDVTLSSGLPNDVEQETFGASWGDYNNDGFLDVFFSIRDENQTNPNLLYKNNGDGTFSNVTEEAGLHLSGFLTFCAAFFDYDKDGYQDIYIANDKYATSNILYHNNGDGTFEDVSVASGTNLIMAAMSTTIDDYNNDGWLDIYISNDEQVIENTTVGNALLKNNGDGTFTNVAISAGVQFNSVGWGCVFLDADNDSDKDLYVSSSETGQNDLITTAFYEQQNDNTFLLNVDVGMEGDIRSSYSNAIGDIDNDGYPEIAVLNDRNENIFLWKNLTNNTNNYLKVKLEGTESNRMGIGSWIEISVNGEKQYNYTLCGEGYLSQNSGSEFFGLGEATSIDYIKVTWLSGQVDFYEDVDVNQTITIVEGQSPLSIEDVQTDFDIQLYPNPTEDFITIKIPEFIEGNSEIKIHNVLGQLVATYSVNENEMVLSTSTFYKGTYFVSFYKGNERITTQKIIKI